MKRLLIFFMLLVSATFSYSQDAPTDTTDVIDFVKARQYLRVVDSLNHQSIRYLTVVKFTREVTSFYEDGAVPFLGDTTRLEFKGSWQGDSRIPWPMYTYQDTIGPIIWPSAEGYKQFVETGVVEQ